GDRQTGTSGAAGGAPRPRSLPAPVRGRAPTASGDRTRWTGRASSRSYAGRSTEDRRGRRPRGARGRRVALRVQAARRKTDEHVARGDRAAVDYPRALDGADDEPGHVVFAVGVEP